MTLSGKESDGCPTIESVTFEPVPPESTESISTKSPETTVVKIKAEVRTAVTGRSMESSTSSVLYGGEGTVRPHQVSPLTVSSSTMEMLMMRTLSSSSVEKLKVFTRSVITCTTFLFSSEPKVVLFYLVEANFWSINT